MDGNTAAEASSVIGLIKNMTLSSAARDVKTVKSGDPNISELLYWVVRYYASFSPEDVAALMGKGANINYSSGENDTLLYVASRELPLFEWFVEKRIDNINLRRFSGGCPDLLVTLISNSMASESKLISILAKLGPRNVTITGRDGKGNTLLHIAAGRGYLNLYVMLLLLGLEPSMKNDAGETSYYPLMGYRILTRVVDLIKAFVRPANSKGVLLEIMPKLAQFNSPTPLSCLKYVGSLSEAPPGFDRNRVASFVTVMEIIASKTPGNAMNRIGIDEISKSPIADEISALVIVDGDQTNQSVPTKSDGVSSENIHAGASLSSELRNPAGPSGPLLQSSGANSVRAVGVGIAVGDGGGGFGGNGMDGMGNGGNGGAPLKDKSCACCANGPSFRDQCCKMFDLADGKDNFCRNSIFGFVLMALSWCLMIGIVFVGSTDL